jgi:hypothetical protein
MVGVGGACILTGDGTSGLVVSAGVSVLLCRKCIKRMMAVQKSRIRVRDIMFVHVHRRSSRSVDGRGSLWIEYLVAIGIPENLGSLRRSSGRKGWMLVLHHEKQPSSGSTIDRRQRPA